MDGAVQPAEDVLETVREIAAEALDVESEEVSIDGDLFEDHGLDSIGIVMIHIELALIFGFPEPASDEDLTDMRSVRTLSAYVEQRRVQEVSV